MWLVSVASSANFNACDCLSLPTSPSTVTQFSTSTVAVVAVPIIFVYPLPSLYASTKKCTRVFQILFETGNTVLCQALSRLMFLSKSQRIPRRPFLCPCIATYPIEKIIHHRFKGAALHSQSGRMRKSYKGSKAQRLARALHSANRNSKTKSLIKDHSVSTYTH